MPETAVDEDHFPERPEYKVRFTRQVFDMQPVAIAEIPADLSDDHFWRRVAGPDPRHVLAALMRCKVIHCGEVSS